MVLVTSEASSECGLVTLEVASCDVRSNGCVFSDLRGRASCDVRGAMGVVLVTSEACEVTESSDVLRPN